MSTAPYYMGSTLGYEGYPSPNPGHANQSSIYGLQPPQVDHLQHMIAQSDGRNSCGEAARQINELNQYDTRFADPASPMTQQSHNHDTALQFTCPEDSNLRRGRLDYVHMTAPSTQPQVSQSRQIHQTDVRSMRKSHKRSASLIDNTEPLTEMYPSSRHSSAPAEVAQPNSKYAAFQGLFHTSDEAKQHRHVQTRFDRGPYTDPVEDPTIHLVEYHRQDNVQRIYNAMVRTDAAKDNVGSVAMRRWCFEPHYHADLVEAYAHKVFDCLIEQVQQGFRGWHQNDYVADERKGEDDDRDFNCADRLDMIIIALEHEKTICEDVMSSASQIRMFVNAPKAYANRKRQNRVGNSKRPNAKAKSTRNTNASRQSKRQRTSEQSIAAYPTATGSGSASHLPARPSLAPALQYPHRPSIQHSHSSPGPHFMNQTSFSSLTPASMTGSNGFQQMPRQVPHMTSIPPLPSFNMSPPMTDTSYLHSVAESSYTPLQQSVQPHAGHTDNNFPALDPVNDPLFSDVGAWAQNVPPVATGPGSTNYFEAHPDAGISLNNVEQLPWDAGNIDNMFAHGQHVDSTLDINLNPPHGMSLHYGDFASELSDRK